MEAARSNFYTAQSLAPHMFEPFFNGALLAFKLGDFQVAALPFPSHVLHLIAPPRCVRLGRIRAGAEGAQGVP